MKDIYKYKKNSQVRIRYREIVHIAFEYICIIMFPCKLIVILWKTLNCVVCIEGFPCHDVHIDKNVTEIQPKLCSFLLEYMYVLQTPLLTETLINDWTTEWLITIVYYCASKIEICNNTVNYFVTDASLPLCIL